MRSHYTGQGVKVAVIDSGINPWHSHVRGVEGGVRIRATKGPLGLELDDRYTDEMGHGTAVAGVIRRWAPECELYSVRVFDRALFTYPSALIEGIEWSLAAGIRVINLSLGTSNEAHLSALRAVCQRALEAGAVLIAAAETGNRGRYPAAFPIVLGVAAQEDCREEELIYVEGDPIEFRAPGQPLPLPGLPQGRNLQGGSFAAARVTGRVATLLEAFPSADLPQLRALLITQATRSTTLRNNLQCSLEHPSP